MKLYRHELVGIPWGAVNASVIAYFYLGIAWVVPFGLLAGAAWYGALLLGFSSLDLICISVGMVIGFGPTHSYLGIAWALAIGLLMGAGLGAVRWFAGPDFFFKIVFPILLASTLASIFPGKVHFDANAVSGTARVEDFTIYYFTRYSSVVHEVDGKPVRATVQTNFHYSEIGSDVLIKYLPEEPTRVKLDSLWENYLVAGLALLLFVGGAVWGILSFLRDPLDVWRRQEKIRRLPGVSP